MNTMILSHRGTALRVTADNTFALSSAYYLADNEAQVVMKALLDRENMPADRRARVILAAFDLARRVANSDLKLTTESWGTMVTVCALLGLPSMVGSSPANPFPQPLPRMVSPEVWHGQFSGDATDWLDEDADTLSEIDALCDRLCAD